MKRKMNLYLVACLIYLAFFGGYYLSRWGTVLPVYKADWGFLLAGIGFSILPMVMGYLAGRADQ